MYQLNLEGNVALVTGGSCGLGRANVTGLARAGADVVIASRKLEGCEAAAGEVRTLGRRALAIAPPTPAGRTPWMPCSKPPTSTSAGSTS